MRGLRESTRKRERAVRERKKRRVMQYGRVCPRIWRYLGWCYWGDEDEALLRVGEDEKEHAHGRGAVDHDARLRISM